MVEQGQKGNIRSLEGVRIVAFTQFLLGPAATQYLADLGADVIKIEPPGRGAFERSWSGAGMASDGVSPFFYLSHRNTRSVALDLKDPKGVQAALRIAATADVVVSNYRPGVLARLGLGYEEIRKRRSDVIYAVASGYGSDGASRDLPGQDLLLQALTGLAAATGSTSDPPVPTGAAIVDQHGASLLALGILGALQHRHRWGEGQMLEVTMVEAALDLQVEPITYYLNGGDVRRPSERLASGFHEAPYGIYPTLDGHVAISLTPISRVSAALGQPGELDGLEDNDCFTNRDSIYRKLAKVLSRSATDDLIKRLRHGGVWCAPVNDYEAAFRDPVLMALDPLIKAEQENGRPITLLRHPVRYGCGEVGVRRNPPSLGEHSKEVLEEVGLPESEIRELMGGTTR